MFALQTWTMVSEQKELLYAIRIFRVDEDGEDRRAESFEVLVRVVSLLFSQFFISSVEFN